MLELLTTGRRKLAGKRAILTGASAGIGRVLAIELAKRGVKLVLVARSRDALLETVAACAAVGGETAIVVDDITLAGTRQAAIEAALDRFGGLDIVINNAGVSALGHFADADEARNRRIMEVNYFAPAELIRSALPHLAKGDDPLVVNIGSVLGHRGVPHMSEYCASKFALRGTQRKSTCRASHQRHRLAAGLPRHGRYGFFRSPAGSSQQTTLVWPARCFCPARRLANLYGDAKPPPRDYRGRGGPLDVAHEPALSAECGPDHLRMG